VGCDGGNSFVRRSLGIRFEDLDFHEPWLVVDMIVEDEHAQLPQTNIQFCSPARPHTYVVGPGRLRRWEFMILPGENADEINRETRIWELLSPWLRPDQARLWRSATYTFHALVAERWRMGNVFLAGDACHMMPPFLAQGMVQGVKDTANLSWKLAHVLRGGSERLLDTYEAERRSLVREVIEITKRLGRVICELDPEKARARDAELIAAMDAGQGIQIRQNLFPPIRHGLVGRSANGSLSPGAGEPCPQPWVVGRDGGARLDDMLPGGFILLLAGDIDLSPALIGQAWEMGVAVHRISRNPSEQPLLEHDPEKWVPVFRKDHAQIKEIERDDDSKKSHHALAVSREPGVGSQEASFSTAGAVSSYLSSSRLRCRGSMPSAQTVTICTTNSPIISAITPATPRASNSITTRNGVTMVAPRPSVLTIPEARKRTSVGNNSGM
jgi:hypothetical protein